MRISALLRGSIRTGANRSIDFPPTTAVGDRRFSRRREHSERRGRACSTLAGRLAHGVGWRERGRQAVPLRLTTGDYGYTLRLPRASERVKQFTLNEIISRRAAEDQRLQRRRSSHFRLILWGSAALREDVNFSADSPARVRAWPGWPWHDPRCSRLKFSDGRRISPGVFKRGMGKMSVTFMLPVQDTLPELCPALFGYLPPRSVNYGLPITIRPKTPKLQNIQKIISAASPPDPNAPVCRCRNLHCSAERRRQRGIRRRDLPPQVRGCEWRRSNS